MVRQCVLGMLLFHDFVQKERRLKINKCYNENCLDTMARMPDGFVDLTVTSPPYDNLRTYNGYCFDFENVARELFRVTKDGGVVVWVVGDATIKGSETGTSFRQALYFKEIGFNKSLDYTAGLQLAGERAGLVLYTHPKNWKYVGLQLNTKLIKIKK